MCAQLLTFLITWGKLITFSEPFAAKGGFSAAGAADGLQGTFTLHYHDATPQFIPSQLPLVAAAAAQQQQLRGLVRATRFFKLVLQSVLSFTQFLLSLLCIPSSVL